MNRKEEIVSLDICRVLLVQRVEMDGTDVMVIDGRNGQDGVGQPGVTGNPGPMGPQGVPGEKGNKGVKITKIIRNVHSRLNLTTLGVSFSGSVIILFSVHKGIAKNQK